MPKVDPNLTPKWATRQDGAIACAVTALKRANLSVSKAKEIVPALAEEMGYRWAEDALKLLEDGCVGPIWMLKP